jgi:hypothetical protein
MNYFSALHAGYKASAPAGGHVVYSANGNISGTRVKPTM